MNYDWQLGGLCQLQLPEKYLLLHITRRVIVEIVESNFAPGNDLGPLCQLYQLDEVVIVGQSSLMWVDANGRVNKFVTLSKLNPTIKRSWPGPAANSDDTLNPSLPRSRDHRLAISVELIHLEVGVGVDEHRSLSLVVSRW